LDRNDAPVTTLAPGAAEHSDALFRAVVEAALDAIAPSYDIDDGLALNQLRLWAPNAAIRRKILVANPARLYDF